MKEIVFKSELLDRINSLYEENNIDQFLLYALTISTFRHITPEYRYCFLYVRNLLNKEKNLKDNRLVRLRSIINQANDYDEEMFKVSLELERFIYSTKDSSGINNDGNDTTDNIQKQLIKKWWEIE